jgi:hypothetical protein
MIKAADPLMEQERMSQRATTPATTRKVAMADEVEVAPWLLVYHGRRFWSLRGACQNFFFSRF